MPEIGTGVFPVSFTAQREKPVAGMQGLPKAVGIRVDRVGAPGFELPAGSGRVPIQYGRIAANFEGNEIHGPLAGAPPFWTPSDPTRIIIPITGLWELRAVFGGFFTVNNAVIGDGYQCGIRRDDGWDLAHGTSYTRTGGASADTTVIVVTASGAHYLEEGQKLQFWLENFDAATGVTYGGPDTPLLGASRYLEAWLIGTV